MIASCANGIIRGLHDIFADVKPDWLGIVTSSNIPVGEGDIRALEKELGFTLPRDYRASLLGSPNYMGKKSEVNANQRVAPRRNGARMGDRQNHLRVK